MESVLLLTRLGKQRWVKLTAKLLENIVSPGLFRSGESPLQPLVLVISLFLQKMPFPVLLPFTIIRDP